MTVFLLLYTSRVIYIALGIRDFGIYSLLGGAIAICGFINTAVGVSTQRFLSFEMGKNNIDGINQTLNASILIHGGIGLIVVILTETVGLLLFSNLTIPLDRMNAAFWSYQALVVGFTVSIVTGPFLALINAKEDMHILVVIEITDIIVRIFLAFIISVIPYDRLISFSFLTVLFSIIDLIAIIFICNQRYKISGLKKDNDTSLIYRMISFSGWNLFGAIAMVGKNQGLALILNMFHGVTVNASYAIANQVSGQLTSFSQSAIRAVNPQITKSFSLGDLEQMYTLVFRSSKFVFFVLFTISITVLFETKLIMSAWLGDVPIYTIAFCRLIIVNSIIDVISFPLMSAIQATGKINRYTSVIGLVLLSIIPISYYLLKANMNPTAILFSMIVITVIALFIRIEFARQLIGLSRIRWMYSVVFKLLPIVLLTLLPVFLINNYMISGVYRFVVICIVVGAVSTISFLIFGLDIYERKYFINKANSYLKNSKC